MRALVLGLLSSCCLAAVASAADIRATKSPTLMTAAPAWSWSGGYIGIHGGWGWGSADQTFRAGSLFAPALGGGFDTDLDGGVVGFHSGHNWQVGNWVFGLEGSTSWTGIEGRSGGVFGGALAGASYRTEIENISTFTPRLGIAFDNWLVYGKAGIAYGRVESWVANGAVTFKEATDHIGWTVGLGVAYALTPNWILGLEYNYVNLGDERYGGFASNGLATDYDNDIAVSTVLARLSYKFGAGGNPITAFLFGPENPAGMWTGLYLGVHGGWGWGDADHRFALGAIGDVDVDGGLGGAHIGYLRQRGNWAFGNEFSLSASGLSGTDAVPGASAKVDLNWLATSTIRLGYTWGPWMLYGRGGGAMGDVESTVSIGAATFRETNAHIGWTLGVGVEYALGNWVAGVEYNYYDLGRERYGALFAPGPLVTDYRVDLAFSSVLARLSYRFGEPAPTVMTRY